MADFEEEALRAARAARAAGDAKRQSAQMAAAATPTLAVESMAEPSQKAVSSLLCPRGPQGGDGACMQVAMLYPLARPSDAAPSSLLPARPSAAVVTAATWPIVAAECAKRLAAYEAGDEAGRQQDSLAAYEAGDEAGHHRDSSGGPALRQCVTALLSCAPSAAVATYRSLPAASKLALLRLLCGAANDCVLVSRALATAQARYVEACFTAMEARREARRVQDERRALVREALESAAVQAQKKPSMKPSVKPSVKPSAAVSEGGGSSPRAPVRSRKCGMVKKAQECRGAAAAGKEAAAAAAEAEAAAAAAAAVAAGEVSEALVTRTYQQLEVAPDEP